MTEWVTMGLLAAVLIVAAISDCRTNRVPNWLTYAATGAGLAWSALLTLIDTRIGSPWVGLQQSAACMAAAWIAFGIIFAAGGLGGGDVKLMGAVGAISASWSCLLATAFYAFVVGAVIAVIVMIRRGLVRRTASRIFSAALMTAARLKAEMPDDSPRIPFGLAICIGGLVAGAETLLGLHTPWAPVW